MARQPSQDSQQGFSGGLNSTSDPSAVAPNQMVRSDNVRLADYGAATKRGGTQRIHTTTLGAHSVKSGYAWRKDTSTVYGLVQFNGAMYSFTWGTFPRTLTNIGVVSDVAVSGAAFRDGSANVVYLASGGALKKWDGTTFTSIATAVQATGVAVYHERLWGWGVAGSLDSVFYSALDNGDTLGVGASSGGQIIVRTFGQRNIVACAAVNTSLLIFHNRGISRLTGYGQNDTTVLPEAVTADVGCVGQQAVCVYDNIAYFVSERGLYQANENNVQPVATPEHPDPIINYLQALSSANLAAVVCAFNRRTREVWIALPETGVFVYHTVIKAWSGPFQDGYLSPDTTALFEMVDSNNQPIFCRGDDSGWVSQCDPGGVYVDNMAAAGTGGTVYNAVIQCHRMYCGDPTTANAFIWAKILAALGGSNSASLSWNTLTDAGTAQIVSGASGLAWGATTSSWGVGTWGVGGQSPYYVRLSGTGPFVDITITDSGQAGAIYASVEVTSKIYGRR